jgi:hypothetical protein
VKVQRFKLSPELSQILHEEEIALHMALAGKAWPKY